MIYFTSDLHFNHDKPFIWQARGFSSVEEMNETIVERFNKIVRPNDILFILGDCIMGSDLNSGMELLHSLPGFKIIILGNHDTSNRIAAYEKVYPVHHAYRIRDKEKGNFYLSHYETNVTNKPWQVEWCLHGHTHSKEKFGQFPYNYNVAVDAHDCYPVSIDQIIEDIKQKEKLK